MRRLQGQGEAEARALAARPGKVLLLSRCSAPPFGHLAVTWEREEMTDARLPLLKNGKSSNAQISPGAEGDPRASVPWTERGRPEHMK